MICWLSTTYVIKRIQEISESRSIHENFECVCTPLILLSYPKAFYSINPINDGYSKPKGKVTKRQHLCENALEVFVNKLVEVVKVF